MNKELLKGNWKQFKGEAKKKWGKLTNDDLDQLDGDREKLLGLIQENYGHTREEAAKEIDEWQKSLAA
ncbi:MAG: CsbD family protein [Pseudomonadota bacterium]|jgi:uncharacterized protein YjbJ (UPF0337 family)|nr:CsbD family protein [Pseudomonadota bacterium]